MSSKYREVNKPAAGPDFLPWYSARCARPVDVVECADGSWGIRVAGRYVGHVHSTPSGRMSARHFGTRARAFPSFLRAMRFARCGK